MAPPIILFLLVVFLGCAPAVRFGRAPATSPPPSSGRSEAAARTKGRPLEINQVEMDKVINAHKGISYRWGGLTEEGMDCSGFVKKVFSEAQKIELPHNAAAQSKYGVRISPSQLKYGDLVFFKINKSFHIDHVGIFVGDEKFVHASVNEGVTVTPLNDDYYWRRFVLAKRLIEEH